MGEEEGMYSNYKIMSSCFRADDTINHEASGSTRQTDWWDTWNGHAVHAVYHRNTGDRPIPLFLLECRSGMFVFLPSNHGA